MTSGTTNPPEKPSSTTIGTISASSAVATRSKPGSTAFPPPTAKMILPSRVSSACRFMPSGNESSPWRSGFGTSASSSSDHEPRLQYAPTPENAVNHAQIAVDAAWNVQRIKLDFSVQSLEDVDRIIGRFHADKEES